jgi:two-component system invasion response regulator UvrY
LPLVVHIINQPNPACTQTQLIRRAPNPNLSDMRRFLIADDHFVVRKGLKSIILEAFPSATIEEVSNAEDLLKKATRELWDLVITDIAMPGPSALDMLQQILIHHPKLPILILSIHSEDQYAIRVLKAGASGYLNKDAASETLIVAIHQLLLGKKYISPAILDKLSDIPDPYSAKMPHENLSARELEVLKLLAVGNSVSEIGEMLSIGATTISTYRTRIMTKMSLKTNADLTLYAIENKLL